MMEGQYKKIFPLIISIFLSTASLAASNKIIVGIDQNFPPHEFIEDNELKGFNIDIINAIGKVIDRQIAFQPDIWVNIYHKLKNKKIDVATMSYLPEREKYFDFTKNSLIELQLAIFVKEDVFGLDNIQKLKNYTVAVEKDDISHIYLIKNKISPIIIPVESQQKAITLVANNAVFAYFGNKYTGLYLKHKLNYKDIKIIGQPIDIGPRKFAVHKGNKKLLLQLDQGLMKIKQSGVYDEIYKKWFGYSYKSYFKIKNIINIVLIVFLVLVAFILVITVWNRLLKISLNRKVKELELSENKYRSLVHNIKSGIICIDQNNIIVIANPAVIELLHIEREDIIGTNILKLKIFSSSYKKLENFIKEKPNITKNFKLIINDIEYIFKISGFSFINERNKEIFAIIITDITEPEIMKEQLLESHKMDALGRLINGITHSFNNIITGIMSSCENLKRTGKVKDSARSEVKLIEKFSNKAKELTDKLSTFTKNQMFNPEVINLNELLLNSQDTLKSLINENIELNLFLSDNLKKIKIDMTQFNQLLFNLVINAQEAMTNGGKIIIETKNITLDKEYCFQYLNVHEGDYILFQFTDTGTGINEEIQKHIFEPFFSTKKHVYSGLGLSIVYGIVKQNNGDIKLYSEKGYGTTFKIFFPVYDKKELPKKAQLKTKQGKRNIQLKDKTMVIIEDDQDIRELMDQFLRLNEINVHSFKNGAEALAFIEQYKTRTKVNKTIDFLITDLVLPDSNGKELSEKIKKDYPKLISIFISGYPEKAMFHQGIIADKQNFLQKPFKLSELLNIIKQNAV